MNIMLKYGRGVGEGSLPKEYCDLYAPSWRIECPVKRCDSILVKLTMLKCFDKNFLFIYVFLYV